LATREARAKAGQSQLDTAQALSDILGKVHSIEKEREKLLNKKLGIIEVDSYIEDSEQEDLTDAEKRNNESR
jgi:hypothetical protein